MLRPCFVFFFSATVLSAIYLQESLKRLEGQLIFVLSGTNFVIRQQKLSVSRDHAGENFSCFCALVLSSLSSCFAGCPGFALEN